MYKAGLFDLDGTLTDSLGLSIQAFIHVFRRHLQLDYSPEDIHRLFGPCEEGIFRQHDEKNAPAMLASFLDFYRRRHDHYAAIYPGVLPVVQQLSRLMPLGIITGKGRLPAAITLEKTGLTPFFPLVISGSCVQRHKPDSQGLEMALAHFQIAPHQAFYLGDSPGDIIAARKAGVAALAALWGAKDKEALQRLTPDAAFTEPSQLIPWLQA